MANKKYNNSFDYVGAFLNDDYYTKISDVSKKAFNDVLEGANDLLNNEFNFSKGNLFEYIEAAKFRVNAARLGDIKEENIVNAGHKGFSKTPEDITYFDQNGDLRFAQLKFSRNPDYIINEMSLDKHIGMDRRCPEDMYDEVRSTLISKLNNGTITENELDTLNHLVKTNTTNAELEVLEGTNGKIDINKVNDYISNQEDKLFFEECMNNVTAVTLSSTVFGCAFSSATNFYKYFRNEQTLSNTFRNIGIDTAKSTGHGLLSASVATGFKYLGYATGSSFLRSSLNSLIIANGAINIAESAYYFKKGKISSDELLHNVMGGAALTMFNIGMNFIIPGLPLVKLVASICAHQIFRGFMCKPNEDSKEIKKYVTKTVECIKVDTKKLDYELQQEINRSEALKKTFNNLFASGNTNLNKQELYEICKDLDILDAYDTYDNFIDDLKNHKKIKIEF